MRIRINHSTFEKLGLSIVQIGIVELMTIDHTSHYFEEYREFIFHNDSRKTIQMVLERMGIDYTIVE